ncbi:MAG TPA: efflux RND transporter periplasmic adaptor subunit [Polyangiaceae bacterium]|nr:efflux RND transporter periplasmic adaptor subunit [Polyangiaceae bacterium]
MRYLIAIVGLLLVIGSLAATKASQISMLMGFGERMKAAGPPPETVATGFVQKQTWGDTVEAVASVGATKGVTLSNDAPGVVTRIHFDSGAMAKPGQVLVELDSAVERAQLASLRTKLKLAKLSLERSTKLVDSGAISKAQLDVDEASYQGLAADEQALVAQIARKTIRAPFGGRLGMRGVNLGQYLAPGTSIAVLESAEAVHVDFTIPQAKLDQLKVGVPVQAFAVNDGPAIAKGAITAIDPALDVATRTVKVRASVEDPERKLQPGMFLRVRVEQPTKREAIVVPSTAIVRASYGDSVFCVEAPTNQTGAASGKIARQQFVKLGETRGDYVAALDGLAAGQEVVTAGAFKLRNGIPIVVNNSVPLDFKTSPTPINR